MRKLTFEETEDGSELEIAFKSMDMYLAMVSFAQWLRSEWKHGDYDKKTHDFIDKCRENFYDSLIERGVNLDSL